MTLNRMVAVILRHFGNNCVISAKAVVLEPTESEPQCLWQKCTWKILVYDIMWFMTTDARFPPDFSWKLIHPHLFHIRVVPHHAAISATAELVNQSTNVPIYSWPTQVGKWVPASAGKAKAGMVHSVSRCTRGVQVKLWDTLSKRAIPERLRGVFTTRRYTNSRLPPHL